MPAFSPDFSVTFHPYTGSHHLPSTYLIVQFQWACILFHWEPTFPQEATFSTRVQYLWAVSSVLSLTDPLISKVTSSASCLPSPSIKWFYASVIQLDSFVSFCTLPYDLPTSKMVFKNVRTSRLTSMAFDHHSVM